MSTQQPINLAVLAGARIPHYVPPPVPHSCPGGPTWHATARPLGQSQGLAHVGVDTWIATGLGQAGTTPSPTMKSIDNGASWQANGTIPNVANSHPTSLAYAPLVGAQGRLLCYIQSQATSAFSDDLGTSWSTQSQGTFVPIDLKFGNGLFVFVNDNTSAPSGGLKTYSTPTGLTPFAAIATPAQASSIHWIAAAGWWLIFERGGQRIWTSPDLTTWTLRGTNPFANGTSVFRLNLAQNGLHLVAGSSDASTFSIYSADGGVTWAASGSLPGFTNVSDVVYGNGVFFLAASSLGAMAVSSDNGATWTLANPMTAGKAWVIEYDGLNTWVAVGGSGADDLIANQGLC